MSYWKQMMYQSVSNPLTLSLLRVLARRARTVTVLMYHELAGDDVDIEAWGVVRKSDFLRQMDYVRRYCDIVALDTAISRLQSGENFTRPMVVVTFDDGDQGNASILYPAIQALDVPVAIYIATQQVVEASPYWFDKVVNALQVDQPLSVDLGEYRIGRFHINRSRGSANWAEIQRLLEALKTITPEARSAAAEKLLGYSRGLDCRFNARIEPLGAREIKYLASSPLITIGAHSHCHNLLTRIAPEEADRSIRLSKTLLEEWTGKPVEHFAYPNGTYDATIVDLVRGAGFRSAMTTEGRLWCQADSLLTIPRMAVGRYDSAAQFRLNLVGGVLRFSPWRRGSRAGLGRHPSAAVMTAKPRGVERLS